jgi:hypothetical protein
MSYLRYLCLFGYSGVQCNTTVFCFCFAFLHLVYPMLPVSLDCPFSIAHSVLSHVYYRPIHTFRYQPLLKEI